MLGYILYDFHFHHSEKKSAEARKVFGNLFTEKDAARVPLTIFVSFHVFRVEKYIFLSRKILSFHGFEALWSHWPGQRRKATVLIFLFLCFVVNLLSISVFCFTYVYRGEKAGIWV